MIKSSLHRRLVGETKQLSIRQKNHNYMLCIVSRVFIEIEGKKENSGQKREIAVWLALAPGNYKSGCVSKHAKESPVRLGLTPEQPNENPQTVK